MQRAARKVLKSYHFSTLTFTVTMMSSTISLNRLISVIIISVRKLELENIDKSDIGLKKRKKVRHQ